MGEAEQIESTGPSTLGRLPDFIIIGAAKSGTSSLFSWLGEHPDVWVPTVKEPRLFSRDEIWGRDWAAYARLFAPAPAGCLTGEGSVKYTDPTKNAVAAERISRLLPSARLIFIARDPVERTRSAYRHEVQRHREGRTFSEAIAEPGNQYVARSRYFTSLAPFLQLIPRGQIHVARTEDLLGPGEGAWAALLSFLDLSPIPRPHTVLNATAGKGRYTPTMRFLYDSGLHRLSRRVPSGLRGRMKSRLISDGAEYERLLRTSMAAVPEEIRDDLMGEEELLWSRVGEQQHG